MKRLISYFSSYTSSFSIAYLVIGLAAFFVGWGLRYFSVQTQDPNSYTEDVRKRIRTELEIAHTDIQSLENQINTGVDSLNFSLLTAQEFTYPIYIFENTELLFWSDNTYLISYDQLNTKEEYTLETPKGIFLIKQQILVTPTKNLTAVVLIPLYSEDKIHNQFLETGINKRIFYAPNVSLRIAEEGTYRVYSVDSNLLFSLIFPSDDSLESPQNYTVLVFLLFALFCVIIQVRQTVHYFLDRGDVWYAFGVLLLTVILIRLLTLILNIPNSIFPSTLFDSRYYASSIISPSLGDLFLNSISVFVVSSFLFVNFSQLVHLRSFGHKRQREWGMILAIVLSFVVMFHHFVNLRNLYLHSPELSLDFTRSLSFPFLKIIALCIGVTTAITYFLLNHVLVRFIEWLRLDYKRMVVLGIKGVLIGWGFAILYAVRIESEWSDLWIGIVHTVYLGLVVFEKLPRSERSLTYQIFIYIFLGAIVTASMSAYTIYCFEQSRETAAKENFGEQLLVERDLLSEFLLNDVVESLPYDPIIKNRLLTSFTTKDIITRKIKKFYLGYRFDKYDISVHIFNGNGTPYDNTSTYEEMQAKYAQTQYATEYKNIYFIHDLSTNTKRYFAFSEISRSGVKIGKIVLELELKKVVANSVYPNLRIEKSYSTSPNNKEWSYAIFSQQEPIFTEGNFVYHRDFLEKFATQTIFQTKSHRHLLIKGSEGKSVVVSSVNYPLKSILTNFSVQFIGIVVVLLLLLLIYRFYFRQQPLRFYLIARIQIYLNLAFFLPSILLSILIVSILNSENKNQTIQTYFQKAENVAQNFSDKLTNYVVYKDVTKENFLNQLKEIARLTQTEINVFDTQGHLLASSQPNIYDNGLVSSLAHPSVLAKLVEQEQNKLLLAEAIGKLEYNSAYVVVRSSVTNEIVGIIDVPFFESQQYADEQIIEVVSTMLNVFTGIFLLLVVFSFFASRDLTKPLNLVTSRLKLISLSGDNKPLEYQSDDEIGLLVREYNKMLIKLEESRAALAKSEKESAWREMAKQVAHEIKNPLTPMKLTLQHLQRVLADEGSPAERSIKSLLSQVDTLSDIATSFSAFAKMPIPKTERFDVSQILQDMIVLYKNDGSVKLDAIIDQGEFFVNGDAKLMGRIFTNLILNGIQAVPNEKEAHINIVLTKNTDRTILIYIRDNGKGIDEETAKKLFIPNFTTKSTGSGIGLSVAKRGIEHAGGKIWFETEPYFGTTFFIELPLG